MGREASITYEQVAAAADALRSESKKPTSRAVRERLGNQGSMGTITKAIQRWRGEQEREQAAALTLPPGLQHVAATLKLTVIAWRRVDEPAATAGIHVDRDLPGEILADFVTR